MGPAGFFDKAPAGLGSLLAGLICSVTEGYALGVWRREREVLVLQTAEILTNAFRIKQMYLLM